MYILTVPHIIITTVLSVDPLQKFASYTEILEWFSGLRSENGVKGREEQSETIWNLGDNGLLWREISYYTYSVYGTCESPGRALTLPPPPNAALILTVRILFNRIFIDVNGINIQSFILVYAACIAYCISRICLQHWEILIISLGKNLCNLQFEMLLALFGRATLTHY